MHGVFLSRLLDLSKRSAWGSNIGGLLLGVYYWGSIICILQYRFALSRISFRQEKKVARIKVTDFLENKLHPLFLRTQPSPDHISEDRFQI